MGMCGVTAAGTGIVLSKLQKVKELDLGNGSKHNEISDRKQINIHLNSVKMSSIQF